MRVERVKLVCLMCGMTMHPHRYPIALFELIDAGQMPPTWDLPCTNCSEILDADTDDNDPAIVTTHFVDRSPYETRVLLSARGVGVS